MDPRIGGEGDGGGIGAVQSQLLHLLFKGIVGFPVGRGKLAVKVFAGFRLAVGRLCGWEDHQPAQHALDQQQAETAFEGRNVGHKDCFLS